MTENIDFKENKQKVVTKSSKERIFKERYGVVTMGGKRVRKGRRVLLFASLGIVSLVFSDILSNVILNSTFFNLLGMVLIVLSLIIGLNRG